MTMIKILKFFPNPDGWHEGDVVDIADPGTLVRDGYVELVLPTPVTTKEKTAEKVKKTIKKGGKK